MNAGKRQAATPTPRAEPPSAVKNVEESRQQRLQRAQARFRDRGGIFVPTNRNTLIDILLGKKEATPKGSTRSRSRSVSPHKPSVSPTSRKGKRVSLSSSAAIAAGEISVHQPELRRSPRKKSTAASSGTTASRKKVPLEPAGKKEKAHIVSDDDIPAAPTTKSGKRKAQVEECPFQEEEPVRKSEKKAAVPVTTGKKGKVAKGNRKQGKEPESSTSRLPSQTADSDTEVQAQPRSKSTTPHPSPNLNGLYPTTLSQSTTNATYATPNPSLFNNCHILNTATLFPTQPHFHCALPGAAAHINSVKGRSGSRIVFSCTWNEKRKKDMEEESRA
ncbi:hypothetical protein NMY22_g5578 [Coprinellus aureogranulatus]|nr:hypothetical protein NMY22_g5578 [Coprinellus aureogranulatus]